MLIKFESSTDRENPVDRKNKSRKYKVNYIDFKYI